MATARNNRILIFDQDGKLLDTWPQFSRPSGIFIDANDMIYVADSESESVSRNHDGWKRGIRIGSAKDGKVIAFIPDPVEKATGTSAAEGVAVDQTGQHLRRRGRAARREESTWNEHASPYDHRVPRDSDVRAALRMFLIA